MSLNSRQQTATALPEWSRFLQSIYFDAEEIEKIAINQGAIDGSAGKQTVALNVRRFQDMIAGKRYPVADTVWNLCAHMRPHGFYWASEPLFLYASGHLSEFVYTVVEIERNGLVETERLLHLFSTIDYAIACESDERCQWEFGESIRRGCPLPADGKNRMSQSSDYEIQICNVIAKHFELGILTQRRAIIEHIIAWLDGKVA